jgi:hypothetical protein
LKIIKDFSVFSWSSKYIQLLLESKKTHIFSGLRTFSNDLDNRPLFGNSIELVHIIQRIICYLMKTTKYENTIFKYCALVSISCWWKITRSHHHLKGLVFNIKSFNLICSFILINTTKEINNIIYNICCVVHIVKTYIILIPFKDL